MIATGLYLDKTARLPSTADHGQCARGGCHDVTHVDAVRRVIARNEFFAVAENEIDFGHCRKPLLVNLRRAARHNDMRVRAIPSRPSRRLGGLAHSLSGNCTAVDNGHVAVPTVEQPADGCALRNVQAAAEIKHIDGLASNRLQSASPV